MVAERPGRISCFPVMSPSLTPVAVHPTHVVGVWRRFTVTVFEGSLDVEEMDTLHGQIMTWRREHPGMTVDLAVIHPTPTSMTTEERKRWLEIIADTEYGRTAGATVVLARGLRGAMHRGIITSMNMLLPPPHPARVFGEVREALSWLSPFIRELCHDAPLLSLERAVLDLQREMRDVRSALQPRD